MRFSKFVYVAALAVAVLVGIAVYLFQMSSSDRAAAGKSSVAVLVATANIDVGISITEAQRRHLIGVEHFPLSALPRGAIRPGMSGGERFYVAVPAGQLILQSALVKPPAPLALPIPDGKVAVTVNIDDASRVAGYAQAGNRVAIYFGRSQVRGTSPELLISRADVLAVGNQSAGLAPSLVTFALKPADAVRLMAATCAGWISLALLGIGSQQ